MIKDRKLLEAIAQSENKACASSAKESLENPDRLEWHRRTCGSFMGYVFAGEHNMAYRAADATNRAAMDKFYYPKLNDQ